MQRSNQLPHRLARSILTNPLLWLVRVAAFGLILLLIGSPRLVDSVSTLVSHIPLAPSLDVASARENMDSLAALQTGSADLHFGLAPLLRQPESRLVIRSNRDTHLATLIYPQQPDDPQAWSGVDSFVAAYQVRRQLLATPAVRQIAFGTLNVTASTADFTDLIDHTAVWVTFTDNTEAVIDLTPLATTFAPRHLPKSRYTSPTLIERRFQARRESLSLNHLQPLAVIEREGELFYLLTKVLIYPDRYEFVLQGHRVQPAAVGKQLRLLDGQRLRASLSRTDFEAIQRELVMAGLSVLDSAPDWLIHQGHADPILNGILRENLDLLWQLLVKLEAEDAAVS